MKIKKITHYNLILALSLSMGLSTTHIKADIADIVAAGAIGTLGIGGAYIFNKCTYNQSKTQHRYLDQFKKDGDYENLDRKARNWYFKKWFSSRLEKEYPVPALERSAHQNSWTLWFFSWNPFSTKSGPMSKKLTKTLPALRNCTQFIEESRRYQKEKSTEEYRDKELRIKENKLNLEHKRDGREQEKNDREKDYYKEFKRDRDGRY